MTRNPAIVFTLAMLVAGLPYRQLLKPVPNSSLGWISRVRA